MMLRSQTSAPFRCSLDVPAAIRPRIPRRVGVDITGILDLAHGRAAATDATAEVSAATTAVHDVDDEGCNESGPAEPQEGAGSLGLSAVLLCVGGAVADAVGRCVGLSLKVNTC
jgi:hypothetical protein